MTTRKVVAARTLYLTDEKALDAFSILSMVVTGFLVRDRFGILNANSKYNLSNRAQAIPCRNDGFVSVSECFDRTAERLFESHQKVVAVWQGGVVSTAMVCALASASQNDNARLSVVCTEVAKSRYEKFYDWLIERNFSVTVFDNHSALLDSLGETDCDAIVTADAGRELLGLSRPLMRPEDSDAYWVDSLAKVWQESRHSVLSEATLQILKDKVNGYAYALGVSVNSFSEFVALFSFGCTCEHERHKANLILHGTANQGKATAFFDNDIFDSYFFDVYASIGELGEKKSRSQITRLVRHYVANCTGDELYFYDNKPVGKRESGYCAVLRILYDDGSVKTCKRVNESDSEASFNKTVLRILKNV